MSGDNVGADYSVNTTELHAAITSMAAIRQPIMVWGPPGVGKSTVARQAADDLGATYVDVRALLLDPVDLRGIPWRDADDRTRWAPPAFLPKPNGDPDERWLINFEELVSAPPMVQAALYQLVLDRKCGEYELPDNAAMIACGNRVSDRGVAHRMPTPLASRFVHVDLGVDNAAWSDWAASHDLAPEVIFFIQWRPELLHDFDPRSEESAFPCPRTWEFVSNIVTGRGDLTPSLERTLFRGAVGEAAATEFSAFLSVWRDLPHPQTIIDDPTGAPIPENASALIALCGSLYRIADDTNLDAIVSYASRADMRKEIGEFLVGSVIKAKPPLQYTRAFVMWTAHNNR